MKAILLALAAGLATAAAVSPASAESRYNGDAVSKRPPYLQYRRGYGTVYHNSDEGEFTIGRNGQKHYLKSPYYTDQGNYPLWAQRAFDPKYRR
jgi:hypothetical protein